MNCYWNNHLKVTEIWLCASQMLFCHFKMPQILFHFTGDLGASAILGSLDYSKYLGKLISYLDPVVPDAFRSEFVRCWHAKTDGSAASTFHSNCDEKGPTVTIIKSGSYIFGGYTDLSWKSKYLWDWMLFSSSLMSFLVSEAFFVSFPITSVLQTLPVAAVLSLF